MTTIAGNTRLLRHVSDLDDNGHYSPVVVYGECNTPPTTSVDLDFDTDYDVDGVDLSGILPAALGLTYSTGVGTAGFTANEDGLWLVHFGASIVAAPGVTGSLILHFPGYGYNATLYVKAAGNDPEWSVDRLMPMRAGQDFSVSQTTSGGVALLTYAVIDIIRVARAIS